jgi:hypothetical protein
MSQSENANAYQDAIRSGSIPSAQQFTALQRTFMEELRKIQGRMELRDKALDQAIKAAPLTNRQDVMKLAQEMHDFLTADLPPLAHQTPAQSAQ